MAELALRWLLLSTHPTARELGDRLRVPSNFVEGAHLDDYWKLQALFARPHLREPPGFDPLLGWVGPLQPETYEHPDEGLIGDRRPVLLYGDSFAQCLTGKELCFQGLLEESELGESHVLLNYGVGGYGLDQIYLLLRESIDRFADRDPLVIVSVLVDDDLERSMLSFRSWPKPRFTLADGVLIEPEPVLPSIAEHIRRHPPRIPSYLFRLFSLRGLDPRDRLRRSAPELEERRTLNRAFLEGIRAELEARSLEHFFLLFYHRYGLRRVGGSAWSEDLLHEFLAESGTPYVSMRDFIAALCGPPWDCLADLSGLGSRNLENHYGPAGNRLAFEAMRQGISGRFGGDVDLDVMRLSALSFKYSELPPRSITLLGRVARLSSASHDQCLRMDTRSGRAGQVLLGLRAIGDHPTRLEIDLDGDTSRLTASLRAVPGGQQDCSGDLRLLVCIDQDPPREEVVAIGDPARPITIDLTGADRLALQLEGGDPDTHCGWIVLAELRLD